jgi:hypothetical protein
MTKITTIAIMIPSPSTLPMEVAEVRVSFAEIFFRNWMEMLDFFRVKVFFIDVILNSNSRLVLMKTCCFVLVQGHWQPEME